MLCGALGLIAAACDGEDGTLDGTTTGQATTGSTTTAGGTTTGTATGVASGLTTGGSTATTGMMSTTTGATGSGATGISGQTTSTAGASDAGVDGSATTDGSATVDGSTSSDSGAGSPLPPTDDYTQPGPLGTTTEANVGPGSNYTIVRPDPMGMDGFVHSPVIFGPGILTSPSTYEDLFANLASHGYVVICVNSLGGGPGAQANLDAMREGLDWMLAQNDAAGPYQGMLAVDRAAAMGYSLGATASVQLSSHEAIATTVSIHGHDTSGDPHGPVLLLTGTDDVIDDVRATHSTLEEAPAVLMALPIGHLDVYFTEIQAGGRYIGPITAWLRYWLNGDSAANRFFWGDGCEMCSSPWITPETNAAWDAQTL